MKILCCKRCKLAILDNSGETSDAAAGRTWVDTALGGRLLDDSEAALAHFVRHCHGDSLLWAGASELSTAAMQRCMVRNRFFLAARGQTCLPTGAGALPLYGELHQLPLPNSCVDAVVLHHALEPLHDARSALREAARVLQPGGRLVLAGLNPWSVLGLRRAWARLFPDLLSGVRFPNPIRVLDWLTVLGFELEEPVRYVSYGLPFRRESVSDAATVDHEEKRPDQRRSDRCTDARVTTGIELPVADVFLLSAVKQSLGVPPLRKAVAPPVGKLAGVAYPKASAQLVHVDFRGENR